MSFMAKPIFRRTVEFSAAAALLGVSFFTPLRKSWEVHLLVSSVVVLAVSARVLPDQRLQPLCE